MAEAPQFVVEELSESEAAAEDIAMHCPTHGCASVSMADLDGNK